MNCTYMKKILIIGCPGSGKSTFAKKLHMLTAIPLVHLDMLFWNEDGTHVERPVFVERLKEAMSHEAWIIDGNYGRTMELRMQECDTVFFLDYPPEVCLSGIAERVGKPRTDMPWTEKEVDKEFREYVETFNDTNRGNIIALLDRCDEKNVIVFKNRSESDLYLEKLK